MIYTVVGYYEDGRIYCSWFETDDEIAAMAQCPRGVKIVGAITGQVEFHYPTDSGSVAAVEDMPGFEPYCLECEGPLTGDDPELCAGCAATAATADAELIAAMEEL